MSYSSNGIYSQGALTLLLRVSPALSFGCGLLLAICPDVAAEISQDINSNKEIARSVAQAADSVTVTGIDLTPTDAGIQVELQTATATLPAPRTEVVGNAVIIDIPNAVLALPEGAEFFAAEPAEGIALITATTLDEQTLRLTITGTEVPPMISPGGNGLTFVVGLGGAGAIAPDEAIVLGIEGAQDSDRLIWREYRYSHRYAAGRGTPVDSGDSSIGV